ncbi:hypothetical protein R3Q06_25510 [Rhodococcus erythropolis]|uniref:hypothetical protein n=1 Tax=Rhodococcus erythropolis TaxID=1833 RepID=UPI002949648D|nr:hypothetical protein [Rhodococcus erythropolis]MDV6276857.1 hypothetical protein [Rhodococcus erythropolis]
MEPRGPAAVYVRWAHICYNHSQWNLNGLRAALGPDATFTLSDQNGALKATWNEYEGPSRETFLTHNVAERSC